MVSKPELTRAMVSTSRPEFLALILSFTLTAIFPRPPLVDVAYPAPEFIDVAYALKHLHAPTMGLDGLNISTLIDYLTARARPQSQLIKCLGLLMIEA